MLSFRREEHFYFITDGPFDRVLDLQPSFFRPMLE